MGTDHGRGIEEACASSAQQAVFAWAYLASSGSTIGHVECDIPPGATVSGISRSQGERAIESNMNGFAWGQKERPD
jgi:hypothetical protein